MLFQRWREIARARANDLALREVATDKNWTFAQLSHLAEQYQSHCPIVFPRGHSAEFILDVLSAWRSGHIVCPLEPAQERPSAAAHGYFGPANIAHLKTTSASTGPSRLVVFTASQLASDADNIVATMGLRADAPNLAAISLAHSYGFSNLVLPLLLHGIPMILAPSALPEALRRSAEGFDSITLPGVPALWRAWHEASAIPPSVKLAISAGAPLPLALEQEVFSCHGLKLHNFYGSSECGGIAYDRSPAPRSDASCIGAPMQNVALMVADDACLEVRGAAVGETYWPEPDPALRAGVFHTSDLVEILDGLVYFRGRACDRINVAGRKVSPEVIEKVLAGHPAVRECLVFGLPSADSGRGETIVACLAIDSALTAETAKQYAMNHLPAWQVPRHWWFVDSLEVNGRGKISRAEWRKRFLDRSQ